MMYIVRSRYDGRELYSSTDRENCIIFIAEECDDDCFIEQLNLFGE
jgi:hypothetical protein